MAVMDTISFRAEIQTQNDRNTPNNLWLPHVFTLLAVNNNDYREQDSAIRAPRLRVLLKRKNNNVAYDKRINNHVVT